MKLLTLLIITIIGMFSSSFPGGGDPACCFRKEHFKQEVWYPTMCTELSKQTKIDWNTARWIHVSSSSRSTKQTSEDEYVKNTLNSRGMITIQDIYMICKVPEDADKVYVLTRDNIYHFLFSFHTKKRELKRIRNKDAIVVTSATLKMKEHSADGFIFYSSSVYSDYRGYFQYKRSEEIFIHQKNCKIVEGKEKCETL